VKINEATVIQPDVFATNGVIHVIDEVLVPSTLDVCVVDISSPVDDDSSSGKTSLRLIYSVVIAPVALLRAVV